MEEALGAMPASQPLSYMEAIRIAEEREANVKQVFDKYDLDKSGTVDMEEMLSLLQDLGLLNRLKTDREKFAAEMFVEYDANDDGVLDFEEFKKLYNAAIDDSLERKRPNAGTRRAAAASSLSRTASGLDNGTIEARKKIAMEKAKKKAEEAERIRLANAEMKARILAQGKGRDPKSLDEEIERKRRELGAARAKAKAEERERLQRENAAFAEKKKSIGAATVNQLSEEENAMRAEAAAAAAKAKAEEQARLQRENADFAKRKQSIGAATDHQLR